LGRLTSLVADDGTVNQTFTYDVEASGQGRPKGKLTQAMANGVVRSLLYTGLNGRLGSVKRSLDGQTFTQGMDYDAYGTLTYRSYTDGRTQTLSTNTSTGLPTSTAFGGAALVSALAYDPTSWNLTGLTYANTASTAYTYDGDQTRLRTLTHNIPGQLANKVWTYSYTGSGLLSSDGEDWFGYDKLGRLTLANVRPVSGASLATSVRQTFDFDAFGNRISSNAVYVTNWAQGSAPPASPAVTGTPLTFPAINAAFSEGNASLLKNQLPGFATNLAATGAQYDAQGNLTQTYPRLGATTEPINLGYDALGRVTSMTFGPSGARKTESYLYDDEGLRVRVLDSAGKARYNIYNEARQLAEQYDRAAGSSVKTWVKDIVYVGTREVAEVSKDGKTYITLTDHLGSPRYQWATGTSVVAQKFLPFGEQLTTPGVAAGFAKGFTNHEQTDASGLIYMQARFYLPMWGRFASPDPARDQHFELTQSWNIYSVSPCDPPAANLRKPNIHAGLVPL
jgi:RHS repeat-associated protein